MTLCLLIADSVYYAKKLIRLIKNHIKILKLLHLKNLPHKS